MHMHMYPLIFHIHTVLKAWVYDTVQDKWGGWSKAGAGGSLHITGQIFMISTELPLFINCMWIHIKGGTQFRSMFKHIYIYICIFIYIYYWKCSFPVNISKLVWWVFFYYKGYFLVHFLSNLQSWGGEREGMTCSKGTNWATGANLNQ